MCSLQQRRNPRFGRTQLAAAAVIAATLFVMSITASAQTYSILHTFSGPDGANPLSTVTLDRAGNIYGTTSFGGSAYQGAVVRLQHKGSGWVATPIYSFPGGAGGMYPEARVMVGPDGSFYGTTTSGGNLACGFDGGGCGLVFNLKPPARAPASVVAPWTATVLYRFAGGSDGATPTGDLAFDQAGNIYGTTQGGGASNAGTVYQLSHSGSGWTENVLYSFRAQGDGEEPYYGVIIDSAGNLYGTASPDGEEQGTVFKLNPSGSGWTESTIYSFAGGSDGGYPGNGLIFDQAGNLYGTTFRDGSGGGGTVYKLTPTNGNWTFSLLYSYDGYYEPAGALVLDAEGNFYGATHLGGPYQLGSIYELSPSNGSWAFTDLHDFNGTFSCTYPSPDGCRPDGVVQDAAGNLYGMTYDGGELTYGVVFQISPH